MKQNKIPRNEYINKPKGKTNPYKDDVIYSDLGQWKYPGQVTRIPSNQITMQGVPYPVQGVDDTGYSQMMYPGMDYTFPGQYVTEYPMARYGGGLPKAQVGKQKGNPISDWWYNNEDVQSTYKMAPDVDPFLYNWLQHPETQKRLKENLNSSVITRDINQKNLTKETLKRLATLPMYSRELVKKAGINQNDIEYNNSLQGWKTPNTILNNPYFSGSPGELGVYMPGYHTSMVNTFKNPGVVIHEQTHATGPFQETMEDVIFDKYFDKKNPDKKFVEEFGDYNYDKHYNKVYDSLEKVKQKYPSIYNDYKEREKYLDDDGMYPRIMDIRRSLNLKPGEKVDKSILDNSAIDLPIYDLRHYYDDDTIIDMLNTLAKNNQTKDLNTAAYGGDPSLTNIEGHYQDGGSQTPEEWEKEIRTVESKIGDPSTWTLDSYKILQDKLNEYKAWRENTEKGKAVVDYHNEPNEYVIPLPSHLQTVPERPFGGQNTKTHTHMQKGGSKKYIAAAETTGLNKPALPVPSLDTLRREKVIRDNRPWNEWSEEEKEYYIMHPLKHPTREQDSIWGERAEEWSRAKAKKEMREDYIRESTRAALIDNPFWNTMVSFTPEGAITSMIKGAFNVAPDVYKSVKDPSLANYANVASDVLSMAHASSLSDRVPKFVGKIANIKNKGVNIPVINSRINVGDLKKTHGVLKKFEPTEKEKTGAINYYSQGGRLLNKQMGGWLDNMDDEYKRGGQKGLKKYTSKNIQSSINDLFTRNETLFGPAGKKRYKPGLKYQSGGNYSIVDYLASKGEDFSKENRQQLAQKYGVKNYDFSAEKNLELLDKLQNSKPIVQKPVAKAPAPSYFIKPIEKENSRATDRTGKTKKVKVPTKEEIAYSQLPKEVKLQIAAQKHAENNQDQLRKYTPQGGISKTWEAISNPMTALRELNTYGYIPDNISQHPDKNPLDMVINPAYPVNAAGRIIKAGFTPQTYSDAAKTALYLGAQLAGDNTASGYDEAAMNTLGLAGDIGAVFGAGQFVKNARRGIRNSKFANELTIGKGANKTTFNDSKEFFDHFNKEAKATGQTRALKKKELDFLNKEIKQRGVLEVNRRNPLDPRQPISKALIIPEDYQWKTVLNPKNIATNLYKTITEGSPESLYTMGQGRVAGWNEYLGMPTKNNPYRIHPESFTKGQGLLYTVPDKEIAKLQKSNQFMPNASSMIEAQQMPSQGIKDLSFYKESLGNTSKEFNQRAYEKIYDDMINVMNPKTGDFLYANEKEIKKILGPKSKFKYDLEKHRTLVPQGDIPDWIGQEGNVYKTGDWDKYIGSHGGVGWNVEKVPGSKYEKWSMEDVWDINPLSRFKKLPSIIKNINAGKILGGKDFKVQLDYFSKPGGEDIIPMIPRAYGGQQKNSVPGWLDNLT